MGSATVTFSESNGVLASIITTDGISNINFGSNDSPNIVPATYPITAQADGHSFEKWIRLNLTNLGIASIIDNFKMWKSAGAYVTGEGISCNLVTSGYAAANYATGGPVESDSAVATVAMPTSEPAGSNVGIGGSLAGQLTATGYTDYIVLQMDVTASTPSGAVNQKTITIQWDEQ